MLFRLCHGEYHERQPTDVVGFARQLFPLRQILETSPPTMANAGERRMSRRGTGIGEWDSLYILIRTDMSKLYGLIYLGSSAAFSSMVGACIVFQTTSYVIPQGILAWRGRDKVLPSRALDLGKYGLPLNVLACVWVFFVDVIYCIPVFRPVTVENMNWIS